MTQSGLEEYESLKSENKCLGLELIKTLILILEAHVSRFPAWCDTDLRLSPSGCVAMTTGAEESLKGPVPDLVVQPTLNT